MKRRLGILIGSLLGITVFCQSPNIIWQKSFGGIGTEHARKIIQTTDAGYIIAGETQSNDGDVTGNHGKSDIWVVKINAAGTILWQKTYGGTNGDDAFGIQQTTDGGYVIAGSTESNDGDVTGNHGGWDLWLIKTDGSGTILWQKTLGGTKGDGGGVNVHQTKDGGYIVACSSESNDGDVSGNHGSEDFWVIKLDASGKIIWQKSLGGSAWDEVHDIRQTTDGGYIVAGMTSSNNGDVKGFHGDVDLWVIKLDPNGAILWQKALGGLGFDEAFGIQQTKNGEYIVAGYAMSNEGDVTNNHGFNDLWIVMLKANGDIAWQRALGGTGFDEANSVQQTTDAGFIVAGFSNSKDGDVSGNKGSNDFWLVKLSACRDVVWQKCLGGSDYDFADCVLQTSDGGYIVAGSSNSKDGNVSGNHGNSDFWIVKLEKENLSGAGTENTGILVVYPNPFKNEISIQTKGCSMESFDYKIVDEKGRTVSSGKSKFNEQMHLENLSAGNYIIQIVTESGVKSSEKLIKSK